MTIATSLAGICNREEETETLYISGVVIDQYAHIGVPNAAIACEAYWYNGTHEGLANGVTTSRADGFFDITLVGMSKAAFHLLIIR